MDDGRAEPGVPPLFRSVVVKAHMGLGLGVWASMPRQCEAKIVCSRDDALAARKVYKLVAVKDMASKHGFSAKKIETIISRGNPIPDEDAPDVPEETRYWCLIDQEKTDTSTLRTAWAAE